MQNERCKCLSKPVCGWFHQWDRFPHPPALMIQQACANHETAVRGEVTRTRGSFLLCSGLTGPTQPTLYIYIIYKMYFI